MHAFRVKMESPHWRTWWKDTLTGIDTFLGDLQTRVDARVNEMEKHDFYAVFGKVVDDDR